MSERIQFKIRMQSVWMDLQQYFTFMKEKIQKNLLFFLKAEDGVGPIQNNKQFKAAIKEVLQISEVQKVQHQDLLYRRECFQTILKIVLLTIVRD